MPYTGIFDTHAHYCAGAFDADRREILAALPEAGVSHVMLCGCTPEDSADCLALAEAYPHIWCAVGIHPEHTGDLPADWFDRIRELAKGERVRAIGEIGLDYHFEGYDAALQRDVLIRQLLLARELDLPVILHIRDAMGDAMDILREYRPKGVIHCYSGSRETAREAVGLGLYLGFGGTLTYHNARRAVQTMREIPEDRILFETDCPYLAPEPHRGERCDSRMIAFTAERAAEIRGTDPQTLIDIARANGLRLFGMTD